ncbi:MAG: hypothetical protein EHM21_10285 [Chloroflexi bacterium]|nr:MAG: hypothetical protein EHM21_10285 [Chloroflexota bacterium]
MSPRELTPIRLVPLTCLKCQSPIAASPEEIAWVCGQCGQGNLLDALPVPGPKESTTRPLDIFFSNASKQGQKGRPFWVARGQVTVTNRQSYKGDEGRAARDFWSAPRLFYVPAWETSIDEIVTLGVYLLRNPQSLSPGAAVPFLPVVTPPGDFRSYVEFMIVSIEADRRDALKSITYDLNLEPLQLWILP